MKKRVHLIISGMVQGVFFRASASSAARKLGLSGWVKNVPNGAVELVAEGEEESLKKLIGWCRTGPSGARVEQVDTKWIEATGEYEGFGVR